tara:strand:- start:979 stop:1752 length:774 start_codon:yes stop_codon:yes gene_type:complete
MIYRDSQLRIFKNVQRREWLKQNRLREPFIRQWKQRLTKYFTDLGNDLKEDFAYGSNTLVDLRINNSANILRNIMRVQYIIVANAFKNYFMDRTQNVKDFDTEFETRLDTYVETNVGELVTNINETTRNRIKNVISDGFDSGQSVNETGNALRNTIIGMGAYRANLIARTEVHRTASFANEISAESMNIAGTQKEWVAVQDARTRVTHAIASGQRVGLQEQFVVGGERLKYPGDPAGSPENTINCRCVSIYTTPDFL